MLQKRFIKAITVKTVILLICAAFFWACSIPGNTPDAGEPAAPRFNLEEGIYESDQQLMLNSDSASGTIHYTVDGSDPTGLSPSYENPITISGEQEAITVKAVTIMPTGKKSETVEKTYKVVYGSWPGVLLWPLPGIYIRDIEVTMAAFGGAEIRYTTDGSNPTQKSKLYKKPVKVTGYGSEILIKAAAFPAGKSPSGISTGWYKVYSDRVATPRITPGDGPVEGPVTVTISCVTNHAAIYYTIDGSKPDKNSIPYTGPFTLPENMSSAIVKAVAYRFGLKPSAYGMSVYEITYNVLSSEDAM